MNYLHWGAQRHDTETPSTGITPQCIPPAEKAKGDPNCQEEWYGRPLQHGRVNGWQAKQQKEKLAKATSFQSKYLNIYVIQVIF